MSSTQQLTEIERGIILRYHEIALKGGNRRWFEDKLAVNARKFLQRALLTAGKNSDVRVEREHGRIVLHTAWNDTAREALSRVFGLSSYSPIRFVATDKDAIKKAAVEELQAYIDANGMPERFRVQVKRSEKALPETSVELDREFGSHVKRTFPNLIVDLENPQAVLGIEIRFDRTYVFALKLRGPGGLPVGSHGRLLALLSGGLDSPVAAIQVLKRGAPVSFLHFHGRPFVGEEVLEKVEDLGRLVNRYQPDPAHLHLVPFGKIQEKIALVTNPKMRTVLYRRMMVRIGCAVARKMGAQALVTGESLGQVASQTLENLSTINSVADLPILRPLVTFDKEEIIELAHKYGTFEVSVRPAADCCTLFADRHPTIRSNEEMIAEQESKYSVPELVAEALAQVETRRL